MLRVLGLDPGSRTTGWAVVGVDNNRIVYESHGILVVPLGGFSEKLGFLLGCVGNLLEELKPNSVAIERVFLGKNADSAFKLGHARGVMMALAAKAGIPVFEYATRLVKKTVTGSGAADKEAVRFVLARLLKIEKVMSLDASDALALAYHHARVQSICDQNFGVRSM